MAANETDEQIWERGQEWILEVIQEAKEVHDLEQQMIKAYPLFLHSEQDAGVDPNDEAYYTVFVAAHSGLIRELLSNLISPSHKLVMKFDKKTGGNNLLIPNTSVSVIEMDPYTTKPLENIHVIDFLNVEHLPAVNAHDD